MVHTLQYITEAMITMSQTEHPETEINLNDPTNLTAILESLKSTYPAYYRAWKSMITSYGAQDVITEWRGTMGLAQFVADTSVLPDSPTFLPNVSVKLKRKLSQFQFSPGNVYWKIPSVAQAKAARIKSNIKAATKFVLPSVGVVQYPARRDEDSPSSIEELKKLYPDATSIEARMNELFAIQFEGAGLTELQAAELDVLGILAKGEEITPQDKFTNV
jgi:hypothetical protein